ncbi:hypothetical protein ACFP6B_01970 [Rothia nasimurium]|uniref:hypothetical protein n=1 Tax=Rothia nasimurium TaxID=85336 RepID=UPI00362270DE
MTGDENEVLGELINEHIHPSIYQYPHVGRVERCQVISDIDTSSQPALFDLSPSISSHQETSYRRKGLRASPNTMFCQLLIETGKYGLPTKSTFSALTASISDPLFVFEVDLEEAEAIANQLIEDKAPELEFIFTIMNNIATPVAPSTSVPPTPVPNIEVRRALDTEDAPNKAPFADEKNKSQQEG